MNTKDDICPNCGAEINDIDTWGTFFSCGTAMKETADGVTIYPSSKCYVHQLAAKDAEIEWVVNALRNLVNDSQHKDHDCGDTPEHCPVLAAREVVSKYGKR